MATLGPEERTSLTGLRVLGQTLSMVAFTLVETVALGLWLTLVRDAPLLSVASALGIGALGVGLVFEHVLTDATVNGLSLAVVPDRQVLGISLSETLLWVVWLGLAAQLGGVGGILGAGVVLAVLLVPQHTVEDNVLRDRPPFSSVLDPMTIGFSLVEAVGATLWLLFVFEGWLFKDVLVALGLGGVGADAVGLAVLAVFLSVEHDIGVALAKQG